MNAIEQMQQIMQEIDTAKYLDSRYPNNSFDIVDAGRYGCIYNEIMISQLTATWSTTDDAKRLEEKLVSLYGKPESSTILSVEIKSWKTRGVDIKLMKEYNRHFFEMSCQYEMFIKS